MYKVFWSSKIPLARRRRMKKQFMKLTMPKFKLSTSTDLTDALQDQGIEKVFTQEADFTPIVGPELGDKDRDSYWKILKTTNR